MLTAPYKALIIQATIETGAMVFVSSLIGILFGLILAVILTITKKGQPTESPLFNATLGLFVNMARSIPFIIFLIAIVPLTKLLTGSTIGLGAAIVPLTLAAIPFYARIAESALMTVPHALTQAIRSMGANQWQLIHKVMIPEALPGLIQGGTLTIISLVGYSAMAGAVGGGGLGQLAIEYGYQRFNTTMMLMTTGILILMVQIIQWVGDYLAKTSVLRPLSVFCILTSLTGLFFLHPGLRTQTNTLAIGITGGPQEKIMQIAKQVAKNQFDLNLKLVVFSDYILPNQALDSGDLDANIFQHKPYLNAQKALHHYKISAIAQTFIYPMGYFSKKVKTLDELPRNALVAIPNDPSNEGRALLLLEHCGQITLRKGVGLMATPMDIISNPKQLRFKTLDAAQIPRAFSSISIGAMTNDFLSITGMNVKESVCLEDTDSPYANVIVIRDNDQRKDLWKKFITVMHSKAVTEATYQAFPNGAAIKAW